MVFRLLASHTRRAISDRGFHRMSKKRTIDAFFAPLAKHRKIEETESTQNEEQSV